MFSGQWSSIVVVVSGVLVVRMVTAVSGVLVLVVQVVSPLPSPLWGCCPRCCRCRRCSGGAPAATVAAVAVVVVVVPPLLLSLL